MRLLHNIKEVFNLRIELLTLSFIHKLGSIIPRA